MLTPTTRTTPDEWARANRTYPPTAGIPGPRDPRLTPYTIPFVRAVHARTHKRVVLVVGSQMGKSDSILDIIGERMDTAPVPMLYLGPTKQFLQEQWEPRIMQLLDEAPPLRFKLARGKRMTKTRKIIAGVPLRLAHGGSSVSLKSDPFGLAFTDEADEMLANVKGSGDPISQVDRRGDTYADFVHAIVSTPTEGPSDVDVDDASGLQFWADIDPQEVASTIWRLWQGGTRYHWAWPCPHCGEYRCGSLLLHRDGLSPSIPCRFVPALPGNLPRLQPDQGEGSCSPAIRKPSATRAAARSGLPDSA